MTEFLKIWDESCRSGDADFHGAAHILDLCLKSPDYTRELYQQLLRETDIHSAASTSDAMFVNTWKLLYIVTAVVPPVDEGVRLAVRLHLRKCMTGQETMPDELVQIIALTKQCYEKMQKAGARQRVPNAEEIRTFLSGSGFRINLVTLDGCCMELEFNMTTLVQEAVVEFAKQVKLANAAHFGLFLSPQELADLRLPTLQRANQGAVPLDPAAYLCDSLPEGDLRAIARGVPCSKPLILKRHVFDTVGEEAVDVKMLQLTLMQVRYDFTRGFYPASAHDRTLLKLLAQQQPSVDALKLLDSLPYGLCLFFKLDLDSAPEQLYGTAITLGLNRRGLHFFRRQPCQHLLSVTPTNVIKVSAVAGSLQIAFKVGDAAHEVSATTDQAVGIAGVWRSILSAPKPQAQSAS